MKTKINPDWKKLNDRKGSFILYDGSLAGIVQPDITRDYNWSVYALTGGHVYHSGHAPDHIAAMHQVEKQLGYEYTVEQEYVMEKGCRCGSCTEPSGKWLLTNREDTVYMKFDSEEEAKEWIEQNEKGSL